MRHSFSEDRYEEMVYRRCGRSGLRLPAVALGCWYNFGHNDDQRAMRKVLRTAFDHGICHFDLANNYGPPPGSAEDSVGRIMKHDFARHREELIISTKAGYRMWPGPYGDGGTRKYLVSSLDQSLKRLRLDYVDIFYHHRPDPRTPLCETVGALEQILRQGKALYVGISNYDAEQTIQACQEMSSRDLQLTVHQARYSMFDRRIEDSLLTETDRLGMGVVVYSPLEQGLLTDKYLDGVPKGSRAAKDWTNFDQEHLSEQRLQKVRRLSEIARERGQSLAQMAVCWTLRDERVTTCLVGASRPEQVEENAAALDDVEFTEEQLAAIEEALA
ncbi:MAG: aldo/keto reductase [Planctomycetota bacterium]